MTTRRERISDYTWDEDGDLVLSESGINRLDEVLSPHEEEEMFDPPFELLGEIEIVIGTDDLIPELETDAPPGLFA